MYLPTLYSNNVILINTNNVKISLTISGQMHANNLLNVYKIRKYMQV